MHGDFVAITLAIFNIFWVLPLEYFTVMDILQK